MRSFFKLLLIVALFVALFRLPAECSTRQRTLSKEDVNVPILLYHRFGPAVSDSMTVTTSVFKADLDYIRANGFTVIPLRRLVDYYMKKGPPPPAGSVVIVADDGHKSVYTEMLPLVKKYRIPVTLFIYPSAISNASYAMTWEELRELRKTGLFDIQGHTFWHPNFRQEKKRLPPASYERFVREQLEKSKSRIGKELGIRVDMLAWPFGICDDDLIRQAAGAGYIAAFTIERRHAVGGDNVMKLPRYLMQDTDRGKAFVKLLGRPQTQTTVMFSRKGD